MELRQRLAAWNGKSSEDIAGIFEELREQEEFAEELISLVVFEESEIASTWLLKALLETKKPLTEALNNALVAAIPMLKHWQSKLHALQVFAYLNFPEHSEAKILAFVRACFQDTNKFVRAWAYHGFFELACQYPEYQSHVTELMEMGLRDETPSVKARIRNLKQRGFNQ